MFNVQSPICDVSVLLKLSLCGFVWLALVWGMWTLYVRDKYEKAFQTDDADVEPARLPCGCVYASGPC